MLPALASGAPLIRLAAAIVQITAADVEAVAELLRLTLAESGVEPDIVTNGYASRWVERAATVLGARVGPRLAGYTMLERGPGPVPFGVVALSVLKSFRHTGLGERLVRALLDEVRRAREIREVWLSVAPDNLPARSLYEKLGFIVRADSPAGLFAPTAYLTMIWQPDR